MLLGYIIRSPAYQFKKYLEDMNTLKLYIVDKRNTKALGLINIDFGPFIFKHIDFKEPKALKSIHDIFCIHKVTGAVASTMFPQKIGELEVSINNVFRNQQDHLKDEPIRESSPHFIDKSMIVQTITESRANIGVKSIKIPDNKKSVYVDPFSRAVDNKSVRNDFKPDLSNILNFAENVLNEIDQEYNKKSVDYDIRNLIDNQNRDNLKERQDPEIELQMLRLKRYERNPEMQVDRSIIEQRPQSANNISLESLKEPSTIFIYIRDMTVTSQNFSKLLNEDVCTLEISLLGMNGSQKDVHKFFIKSSSKLKVFHIDKTVAFDLKFNDSKNFQEFINSTILFKLCQRKTIEKGKSSQVAIAEYSMSTLDCWNLATNENGNKIITFHISEKRSKTPVKMNPTNLKKVTKDSAFGQLNIQIRKGAAQPTKITIKEESKPEHKIGIVVYMTEIRNIQLTGSYITVATGGLDLKPSKQAINIIDGDDNNLFVDYCKLIYTDSIIDKPLVFKFFTKRRESENEEVLGFCSLTLNIDRNTLADTNEECLIIENGLFEVIDITRQPKFFVYMKIFAGNASMAIKLYNDLCNNNPYLNSQKISKTLPPSEYQNSKRIIKETEEDVKISAEDNLCNKNVNIKSEISQLEPSKKKQIIFKAEEDIHQSANDSHLMVKQSAIDKLKLILNPNQSRLSDSARIALKSHRDLDRLSANFDVNHISTKQFSRNVSGLKQSGYKFRSDPVTNLVNSGIAKIKNNLITTTDENLIVNKLETDRESQSDVSPKNEGTMSYYMRHFKIKTDNLKPKFETFAPDKPLITESILNQLDLPLTELSDDTILDDPLRLLIRFFDIIIKVDKDLVANLNTDFLTYEDFLALVQQYDLNLVIEEVDLLLTLFDYRNDKTINKFSIEDAFCSYYNYRITYITNTLSDYFNQLNDNYDNIKRNLFKKIDQLNRRTQSSYLSKNFINTEDPITPTVDNLYSRLIYGYNKQVTENNIKNFEKVMNILLDEPTTSIEFKNSLGYLLSRQPFLELHPSFSENFIKEFYKKNLNFKNLEKVFENRSKNVTLPELIIAIDDSQVQHSDLSNIYNICSLFNNIVNLKGDITFTIQSKIPYITLEPYLGISTYDDYDDLIPLLNPHLPVKSSTFKYGTHNNVESSLNETKRDNSIKEDDTIMSSNRSYKSFKRSPDAYNNYNKYKTLSVRNDDMFEDKNSKLQKNVEEILDKYRSDATDFKPIAKYTLSIKLNKYELSEEMGNEFIGKRVAFRYRLFGTNKNYETTIYELNSVDKSVHLNSKTLHVVHLDAKSDYKDKLSQILHDLEIQLVGYKSSGDHDVLGVSCISALRFAKESFIDDKLILVPQGELLNSFGNNIGKLDVTVNSHFEITKGSMIALEKFEDVVTDRNYPLHGYFTIRIARFDKLESLFFIADRLKYKTGEIFEKNIQKIFRLKLSIDNNYIDHFNECLYEEPFTDFKSLLSIFDAVQSNKLKKVNYKRILHLDFNGLTDLLKSAFEFKLFLEITIKQIDNGSHKLLYTSELATRHLHMKECLPKYNNDDKEVYLNLDDSSKVPLLKSLLLFNYLPYDQPVYPSTKSYNKIANLAFKPVKLIQINDNIAILNNNDLILSIYSNSGLCISEITFNIVNPSKTHKITSYDIQSDFSSFFTCSSEENLKAKVIDNNNNVIFTFTINIDQNKHEFNINDFIGYGQTSRLMFKCISAPQVNNNIEITKLRKIASILNNKMFASVEFFKSLYPYNCDISIVDHNNHTDTKKISISVDWQQFKVYLIDKFEIVKSEGEIIKQSLKNTRTGIVDIKGLFWFNIIAVCEIMDSSLFKGCYNELRYYDEPIGEIEGFISIDNYKDIIDRYQITVYDMDILKFNKSLPTILDDTKPSQYMDYLLLMGTFDIKNYQTMKSLKLESPIETSVHLPPPETIEVSLPTINLKELEIYDNFQFAWRIKRIELKSIESIIKDKTQKPNIFVDMICQNVPDSRITPKIQYRTLDPIWNDVTPYITSYESIKNWLTVSRCLNIYFREFANRIHNSVIDELQLSINFRFIDAINIKELASAIKHSSIYNYTLSLIEDRVPVNIEIEVNFGSSLNDESSSIDAGLLNTIKTLGELRHQDVDHKLYIDTEEHIDEGDNVGIDSDIIKFITNEIQNSSEPEKRPKGEYNESFKRKEHVNILRNNNHAYDKPNTFSTGNVNKDNRLVFDFDSDKLLKSIRKTDEIINNDKYTITERRSPIQKPLYENSSEYKAVNDLLADIKELEKDTGFKVREFDEIPARYVVIVDRRDPSPDRSPKGTCLSAEIKANPQINNIIAREHTEKKIKDIATTTKHLNNRGNQQPDYFTANNDEAIDLIDLNISQHIKSNNNTNELYNINIVPDNYTKTFPKDDAIERDSEVYIHKHVDKKIYEINKQPAKIKKLPIKNQNNYNMRRPPALIKDYSPISIKAELNYSQSDIEIEDLNESHTDIINRLPEDLFTEVEKTRLERLLKDNKIKPDLFNFDSGSDIE